jgi:transcriptional regulator GlxA family with amidase domain
MLRDIAALVGSHIHPFELGTVCEVFGIDRSADGVPAFDFAVCACDQRPSHMAGGMTVQPRHGLERALSADLIAIPGWVPGDEPPGPEVVEVLHAAVDRGATVLGVCSGAFLLAAAGLLDNRRATCHWYHADRLSARFPTIALEHDRLYVEDGPVVTSAGTAAGIDACLHIVRRELGARVANTIARRMVIPPHRDGGQAQYVETPVPKRNGGDELGLLLDWIQAHLDEPHTVAELAARLHMSPRTFARRFTNSTGAAPHQWITRQRVLLAQRLLEEDSLEVEEIARRTGFGAAESLRHHFTRQLGTTPTAYRSTFSHQLNPA